MTYLEIKSVSYGTNKTILRERPLSLQISGVVKGGAKLYTHEEDGTYYFDFYLKLYPSQSALTPLKTFPLTWLPQSNPSILNNQPLTFDITVTLPETFDNNNDTNVYWLGITGNYNNNTTSGRAGTWYAKPQIILRNQRTGINISATRPTTYGQNYTVPAIPNYRGYLTPTVWHDYFDQSVWMPGNQITIKQFRFPGHNDPLILNAEYDTPIVYPITLSNNEGAILSQDTYTINENSSATVTIDATSITPGYQITVMPVIIRDHTGGGDAVSISKHPYSYIYYLNIPAASYGELDIDMKISPITYNISYMNVITSHNNPTLYNIESNTITLTPPVASPGYTFEGWFTDSTGGVQISNIPSGSIGNRILYARWAPITYDVIIDENGGQSVSDMNYTIETYSITLPVAVRDGYTFTGYTRSSGPTSGNPSISGNTLTFNGSYGDITVRMNWSIINYSISYIGDTAGLSGLKTSFNINDLNLTLDQPIRPYYLVEFDYYTISTIGNKVITITQTPYNVTFLYNKNQAQTITDVLGNMPDKVVNYMPGNVLVSLDKNLYSAEGYSFEGWRIDNEGSIISDQHGKLLPNWNSDVINGNVEVELYAQWNMINYIISYVGNTTGLTFNKTSFNIEELDDESYHIELEIPTRTGYTVGFDETVIDSIGNKTITVTQDVIVYTIIFNSQGGSSISNIQYNIEQSVNLTNIIPVREGYTFNGWFTSLTGGTKITSYPVGTNGNKTLYAQWSINSYNIVFRNKYDSVDTILKTYSVEYNSTINAELFDGVIPSRPNVGNKIYTFIGWHTDFNEPTPLSNLGKVPIGGKTFYAIYSSKIKGLRKGASNVAFALGDTLLNNVALGEDIIWEKDDE